MRQTSPVRGQPIALVPVLIRLRGAGAAAPVVEVGPNGNTRAAASATSNECGVTTSRAAAGDYTISFGSEKVGALVYVSPTMGSDVLSATSKKDVNWESDSMTATGTTFRILVVTPSTDAAAAAAADLATGDVVGLTCWFRTSSV